MPRADSLSNDVESLKKLLHAARDQVQSLCAQLHSRNVLIEQMKLQLAQLKRMKFGRSSEQLDAQIAQLELSLEELEANAAEAPILSDLPVRATMKPARQALPEQLPRESHVHDPVSGTCECPNCGGALRAIGEDVSEVLEYVPQHWKVHRHVRPKYTCTSCEGFVQASAPSRPIERSYVGPGLLAHVVVSKYCDHLPLYRQSQIYARAGVDLDRATLAEWVGSVSALVAPLIDALDECPEAACRGHADPGIGAWHW